MKTIVIMMGGRSSRMGRDKCDLELNGRRTLERIIDEVAPYFEEIIFSTNDGGKYVRYGFKCVRDEALDFGPAGGLLSVMNACPRDYYQTAPCDAPFLSGAALSRIYELSQGAGVGLVRTPDGPQPLFSTYSFAARDALAAGLSAGVFKILACLKGLDIREITLDQLGLADCWEKHFFNVNSPEDVERAIAMDCQD
jgi:molybdenum cofactor guanylyltransferase